MRRLARGALAVAVVALLVIAVTAVATAVGWLSDRPLRTITAGALVVLGALVVARVTAGVAKARSRWVLEWELDDVPPESVSPSPLDLLSRERQALTMRDTVELLDRAAADKRVRGLFLNLGFGEGTMAAVQELRDAIGRFRAAGKPVVAFADSFGGNLPYLLASAADEVFLQRGGSVQMIGFARDVNFLRGALDKADLAFEVVKRHAYKNAYDQLAEQGFTAPHREALGRVYELVHQQLVASVAEGRGLAVRAVEDLLQRGPLEDEEARAGGLVDRIGYRDEAITRVRELSGTDSLLYLDRYKKRSRKPIGGKTVAIITATGPILPRRGGGPPIMPGGRPMDASVIAAALRKAAGDKKVKAIVLRVESPGGSAVASETIWREVVRARQAGKPVVASMAGIATSGGYFISAPADRIVAHPGTITGSIGVLTGKPVIGGLKERAGIVVEEVSTAANAGLLSLNRRWNDSERERIDAGLDAVYENFTTKVAEGRGLEIERVREIAKGRVWLGVDAAEIGLVDALGGLPAAVDAARELADLAPDAKVRLRPYPKAPSALSQLSKRKGDSSEDRKAARALLESAAAVAAMAGPLLEAAAGAGLLGQRGELHAGLERSDWTLH